MKLVLEESLKCLKQERVANGGLFLSPPRKPRSPALQMQNRRARSQPGA